MILSAPGPLVVGIGLFFGRSSTQLADFVRRSAELIAIIVSWVIYRKTNKEDVDLLRRERLERIANICVGIAMCVSGIVMLLLALISDNHEKGNVIPGLVIAGMGVAVNTWFWLRYRSLNKRTPDAILAVQSRLYRAKSLVDTAVVIALATVLLAPGTPAALFMDKAGSVVVAIYLIINGIIAAKGGHIPVEIPTPEAATAESISE
ncbi:MAG: cation transporter [Ancrocorticia sp.]